MNQKDDKQRLALACKKFLNHIYNNEDIRILNEAQFVCIEHECYDTVPGSIKWSCHSHDEIRGFLEEFERETGTKVLIVHAQVDVPSAVIARKDEQFSTLIKEVSFGPMDPDPSDPSDFWDYFCVHEVYCEYHKASG